MQFQHPNPALMVLIRLSCFFLLLLSLSACSGQPAKKDRPATASSVKQDDEDYLVCIAKPGQVRMFWKDRNGNLLKNLDQLTTVEPNLVFAMNGGMFQEDFSPTGLYVEKGKQLRALKKYNNSNVNFGIQPQGVFLIRKGKAEVTTVAAYTKKGVVFATQSAPMLVINGKMNTRLPKGRQLKRNGVGILKNGSVLMAVSRGGVSFHEFAQWFIRQGCTSALFLDGSVSEAWCPGFFTFGDFGVMVGVVKE